MQKIVLEGFCCFVSSYVSEDGFELIFQSLPKVLDPDLFNTRDWTQVFV